MDLWIRSQDKECLMKINRIDYDVAGGEHRIIVNGYETLVGKYKTKERALEVLDEIQKYIGDNFNQEEVNHFFGLNAKNRMIYEMPKE